MDLPFLVPAAGFAAGIFLSLFFCLPALPLHAACAVLFPVLWRLRPSNRIFTPFFLVLWTFLGQLYVSGRPLPLQNSVELHASEAAVNLSGTVASFPVEKQMGKRRRVAFEVQARSLVTVLPEGLEEKPVEGRVQVYLYNPWSEPGLGDQVFLHGLLKVPGPRRNPDGFDLGDYLAGKGIRCFFQGYGMKALTITARSSRSPVRWINRLRTGIKERIASLWLPEEAPYFQALILGNAANVPKNRYASFVNTGTAHLLSVSGLHLTLITGTLLWLLLLSGWEQREAALGCLAGAFLFSVVGGFSIPLQRSFVMTAAACLGLVLGRERSTLNCFFLAVLALLLSNPQALFSVSFQLSFISVLSLLVLITGSAEGLGGNIRSSMAAFAGTFPLILFHFKIFPVYFLPANLLAIPLFHAGLILGFAAVVLAPAGWAGWLAARGAALAIQSCLGALSILSRLPAGYFITAKPPPALIWVYYGLLGIYLAVRNASGHGGKWLRRGAVSALVVTGILFLLPARPVFFVNFFSSGNRLLALVHGENGARWLLFSGSAGQLGKVLESEVKPFLLSRGMSGIDGILLTSGSATGEVRDRFPEDLSVGKVASAMAGAVYPLGPDTVMKVVGAAGTGSVLQLLCKDGEILFAPDASPRVLELLGGLPRIIGTVRLLVLYAPEPGSSEEISRLAVRLEAGKVVICGKIPDMPETAPPDRAALYRLEDTGALLLNRARGGGLRLKSTLSGSSFSRGQLLN